MVTFITIAIVCTVWLVLSFLVFDDIDIADALDFTDDGWSGWFSLRNILLFGLGFGAAGAIAVDSGLTVRMASLIGVGTGIVLYALGIGAGVLLNSQESNSLQSLDALLHQTGFVALKIQNQFHVGEVRIGAQHHPARAPYAIDEGTLVRVMGYSGFTLLVKRADDPNSRFSV